MNIRCVEIPERKLNIHSARTERSKYLSDLELLKRIGTFSNWPFSISKSVKPYLLASAGFSYTTFKDEVRCEACGIEHGHWKEGDRPIDIHRQKKPNCEFLSALTQSDIVTDTEEEEPEEVYDEIDLAESASQIKENKTQRRLIASTDINALMAENERLKKELKCKRCSAESIQTLFLPCRHLVSCESCADKVENCFYCTTKIMGTVRAYVI
jgi:baculoviral IAP repeat-containing protein 7/8